MGKIDRAEFIDGSVVGDSPPIRRVKALIKLVAEHPGATALITGETGSGKSLAAKVIHHASENSAEPFMEVNCSAIPPTLLESQLFGHKKGAFTGATDKSVGMAEKAGKGTLFLDEIGELPLELQAKLLTLVERRRFIPVGDTRERKMEARLITASNRDLSDLVAEGKFRKDLFYRLNVLMIEAPPLRNIGDDLFKLAKIFLDVFNRKYGKELTGFSSGARELLGEHDWPGNARELRNVVERATVLASEGELTEEHIVIQSVEGGGERKRKAERFSLPEEGVSLEEVEKRLIREALERADGNQSEAARLLGLSRETLRYRANKYDLS
ncbi:MAG: AAA domain-containing protein [Ignavibacteriales bacterium]|nr:AAA domain-containing protein [Ignavibacteriales bacterium]